MPMSILRKSDSSSTLRIEEVPIISSSEATL